MELCGSARFIVGWLRGYRDHGAIHAGGEGDVIMAGAESVRCLRICLVQYRYALVVLAFIIFGAKRVWSTASFGVGGARFKGGVEDAVDAQDRTALVAAFCTSAEPAFNRLPYRRALHPLKPWQRRKL
jgi:hypothetical protein